MHRVQRIDPLHNRLVPLCDGRRGMLGCSHLLIAVEFQDPFAYQPLEPGILAMQAGFAFRRLSAFKGLRNID